MARCLSAGRMCSLAGLAVALSLTITGVNGARIGLENGQVESTTSLSPAAAFLSGGGRGFGRKLHQSTPVACSPCAQPTPDVYFSTGSGANPPNGIWRIKNFNPNDTTTDRDIEFLCRLSGLSGQVADIAVNYYRDLIVIDTNSNLYYYKDVTLLGATTDYTTICNLTSTALGRLSTTASLSGTPTGLSSGFTSDSFLVSTNDGSVVPFKLDRYPSDPIQYQVTAAAYGSAVAGGTGTVCYTGAPRNSGGTDIATGPDNQFYRFWATLEALPAPGTLYTTSRFSTSTAADGNPHLDTFDGYIHTGLTANNLLSNSGAFCTDAFVVGVAAEVRTTSGRLAYFWSMYNATEGQATAYSTSTNVALRAAKPLGQTITTVGPDRLRINGAATRCSVNF